MTLWCSEFHKWLESSSIAHQIAGGPDSWAYRLSFNCRSQGSS